MFCFEMSVLTCIVYYCIYALSCLLEYVDIFLFVLSLIYIYKFVFMSVFIQIYYIYVDFALALVWFFVYADYLFIMYIIYRAKAIDVIFSFIYNIFKMCDFDNEDNLSAILQSILCNNNVIIAMRVIIIAIVMFFCFFNCNFVTFGFISSFQRRMPTNAGMIYFFSSGEVTVKI